MGVAVHSSGELGIQLATMLHLGAVLPNLGYAADAHYHHLADDVIAGGKMKYAARRDPRARRQRARRRARPRQARALSRALPGAGRLPLRPRPGAPGLVSDGAQPRLGRPVEIADAAPRMGTRQSAPVRLDASAERHDQPRRTGTMSGRLAGKTALITAAGQGIGHATAMAMASEGARSTRPTSTRSSLENYAGVADVSPRILDVLDDAAHREARRRVAAARHPVQLRRLRPPRHHPRLRAEGLGLQLQPQRPRDVRDDPLHAAEDARQVRGERPRLVASST